MATIMLRDSTQMGDYQKPYIVAEVNSSHNGNMDTVFEMILKAKEIGFNCVKFQSWSAESLYSKTYYDENPIAKRIVSKFSLSEEQLLEAARFCKEQEIAFASTPYSRQEVDFLIEKCEVPYIKVASMELNNYSFLEYIAQTGVPIVLSTGMGDMEEIRRAVEVIKNAGNEKLCLLHCISIYPAEISTVRLNNILGLREEFPDCPIGFSDHSIGVEIATASVALGAAMIEKHFTLDQNKIGMDNQMATEPEEMARMVQGCHNVFNALGGKERIVSSEELEQRKKMRRSVVAAEDLKAGTKITEADLELKRPGNGCPPEKMNELVGRVLKRDIMSDTMIYESDLME
ncbi:N-acetylneuraminate synthase family protein [Paenibacillus motobuensis]|uniref:N-acetylneuraminate synthase family protein n=1 Tax=Paenibacillus TaxID=44249 RepID=UPI00203F0191|nr:MULTISPECIES: N-acetylneuraminate synthase family protein [Paenibacillus]MCM3040919.1 N-acetylneuraminate synthase family protein [Paenibacillus lutimineralis]MCM3648023.1 N-acetylneuraminate synthase family protein [Paenibacillus motobuensis]